ncbi:hypothetical protein BKA62DRAFT_721276 [Auriculariales sp. MPI-PUGE-AT-0066]|nr:hypothetical protein BKA62DRAFT_721276 [Auriculariales sp. MPI-PUGE-AT-0066]
MTIDWHDPMILYRSGRAFILITHLFAGMYFWEFLITLPFDWELLRGKRKLTFGTTVYLLPRYANLITSILALRITNVFSADVNCKIWIDVTYAFVFGTIGLTSGVLYIRVCAVSKGNRFIKFGMGAAYLGYWGLVAYSVYQPVGYYVEALLTCAVTNVGIHRATTLYMFGFDLICLSIVLIYLLRMHRGDHSGSFYCNRCGIVYIACICVAYLVAVIFPLINLNDAISESSGTAAVFVTTVCATRMQRGLLEFFLSPAGRTVTSGIASVSYAQPYDLSKHTAAISRNGGVGSVHVETTMHVHTENADDGDYKMEPYRSTRGAGEGGTDNLGQV